MVYRGEPADSRTRSVVVADAETQNKPKRRGEAKVSDAANLKRAPTHTMLDSPRISGRRLAEYMAASPIRQRTIIRDTKFRPVEPEISYDEGYQLIGDMLSEGPLVTSALREAAEDFHDRMDVRGIRERIAYDLIGDMFEWLAEERPEFGLPDVERFDDSRAWGQGGEFRMGGVVVDPEVHFRLRKMKRNAAGVGVVSLRYSKSGPVNDTVAEWQAALLYGYLLETVDDEGLRPDPDLCILLDLRSGIAHPAPGRAKTLFKQMEAACASIAERWPAIKPPDRAVVGDVRDLAGVRVVEQEIPF